MFTNQTHSNSWLLFWLYRWFLLLRCNLPEKKPNIILILADDMGYSDIGCFGSEIQTPNLNELAKNGLRMPQFYNASRCCPTRASLLTGLFQHQAGVGDMVNTRAQPAYQGYLNQHCVTIAEALKQSGYKTYMAGKWHVGTKPEGWPVKRGFDRYFGLIDGASSYFGNSSYRPNQKLTIALDDQEYTPEKGYYATNAFTDHALEFIGAEPERQTVFPIHGFYRSPLATCMRCRKTLPKTGEPIEKAGTNFAKSGFERMLEWEFWLKTPSFRPAITTIPAWDSLSEEEKKDWEDKMAVYAAMIDRMDQNIGRIRQKLKETGQDQNTVIMFFRTMEPATKILITPDFCLLFTKAARNRPVILAPLPPMECGAPT
jgi:arylsulfatase A-like enzyme